MQKMVIVGVLVGFILLFGSMALPDGLNRPLLLIAAQPGDLDGDGDVDQNDVNILLADRNKPVAESTCGSACDLDGDGVITALDARKLATLCTRPNCATQS